MVRDFFVQMFLRSVDKHKTLWKELRRLGHDPVEEETHTNYLHRLRCKNCMRMAEFNKMRPDLGASGTGLTMGGCPRYARKK